MWEQIKRRSSYQALPLIEAKKPSELYKDLHHPVFQNIRIVQVDNGRGNLINQTIITLTKIITTQALHQCLKFIYTGTIEKELNNIQVISLFTNFREYFRTIEIFESENFL